MCVCSTTATASSTRCGQVPKLELFHYDREEGWLDAEILPRGTASVPDVSFRDPRVRLADMSGDGLADMVLVRDGLSSTARTSAGACGAKRCGWATAPGSGTRGRASVSTRAG